MVIGFATRSPTAVERQCERKRRASPGCAVGDNRATVALDNLPANRQADASTFVFLSSVQALKDLENALAILGFEPDAIVAHDDFGHVAAATAGNRHHGRCIGVSKLERITNQIQEQLPHLQRCREDRRETANFDSPTGLMESQLQVGQDIFDGGAEIE